MPVPLSHEEEADLRQRISEIPELLKRAEEERRVNMIEKQYKKVDSRAFTTDWPHGHVTRDGRKVRILCTDLRDFSRVGGGTYPIVAAVDQGDGKERLITYTGNGRQFSGEMSDADLVNAPAPKERFARWVILTREKGCGTIRSKASAEYPPPNVGDWFEGYRVIATKRVDLEEGENS